jgi:hypothetical protein
MRQYQVKLEMGLNNKYSGVFNFNTLAGAIEKVKSNLDTEITRMGAKIAIEENGRADYWDAESNHAKIIKI